jgi:hypothetical protein
VILFRTSATLEKMKRIAFYCGSNKGTRPDYAGAAEKLGRPLARWHVFQGLDELGGCFACFSFRPRVITRLLLASV